MNVVIVGAGEVGFHLAKLLSKEGHDLYIIDHDVTRLQRAAANLDVEILHAESYATGEVLSKKLLAQANVEDADLLITVTYSESVNISAAIMGKEMGARHTIARAKNTSLVDEKNGFDFKKFGVDQIIIPELLVAKEIERLLRQSEFTDTFDFDQGALQLVGLKLDKDHEIVGQTIAETWPSATLRHFTNVAILRQNKTLIPSGDTRFEPHDHLYFIAQPDAIATLANISSASRKEIEHVVLLGGDRVGGNTAMRLLNKYKLRIVEQDRERCIRLADEFRDAIIVHGDGRDMELLMMDEGLDETDAFVALTGNSEANMISALAAKNQGVGKAIALVENMDYIPLSQSIGVDTLINKKLISANFIFSYIRREEIISLTSIPGVNAEVVEMKVKENSRILHAELSKLDFPSQAVIGGVIRKGVGLTVRGDFRFMPQDNVVLLCQPDGARRVAKFFQ